MQSNADILYRINKDDVIVFINDAWDSFAIKNDAPGIISANVLNRSLWDFIIDETTRSLYRHILMLVRNGKFLQFNYSCDSPDKLRFMEMTVTAGKDGEVQFQSKILQSKERVPQRVLDRNALRTDDLIRICSWCKSIDTGSEEWKYLDEAISILDLFNQVNLPRLTHSICQNCYLALSNKLA